MASAGTVQWSMDLPSTPCAVRGGEVIFVATNSANGDQAVLHAITLAGQELWSRTFEKAFVSGLETLVETLEVSKTSRVLVALSSADLLRGEGIILALNEDGQEAWRWTGNVQKVSASAIVGDLIYFTADGQTLVCLDTVTGREDRRWALPVTASFSAPLVTTDAIYIPCRGPQVLAYDLNGQVRWQFTHDDSAAWLDQTPAASDDVLVVVSSRGEVLLLDRPTGALRQRVSIGLTGKALSAPTTAGTRVFIGARDGVYAVDRRAGRVVWHFATTRRVSATPIVDGDSVYAACHDHRLYALNAQTGDRLWDYAAAHHIEIPPLVSPDGTLILITDHAYQAGTLTAIERPLTADELAARRRWREAAEQYAADQRSLPQARALMAHARQIERDRSLEEAGSIWEQAAQLFSAEHEREPQQTCQCEAARCRQQPILSIDVKYGALHQDVWAQLDFSVTNTGYGPARSVIIHAEGDQFEGQVMATQRIATLTVGRSQTDQLDVKPRAVGRVPLRLGVEYTDRTGTAHSFKRTLYVDVAPFTTAASRSGGVDINAQNVTIYGDVSGRDKTNEAH